MSFQNIAKGTLRVAKNYTKGYSDVQAKVREATSNDPWGPSGSQMNEIAQMTYNQNDFVEIMEMLDKRLNDKGKNWRHVFKALTLLDYCLHAGSENVVIYFKDNVYIIKTLKEFQYIDEYEKDQGANVRQKAKDITNLLADEGRLKEARKNRASMRDRMVRGEGGEFDEPEDSGARSRSVDRPRERERRKPNHREDDDLKKAIEASKASFDKEVGGGSMTAEERDMAAAIKLSKDEDERKKREGTNDLSKGLFDETQPVQQPQQTNPFPLVNFDQGPQNGMQLQPQYTTFNPYAQQQLLQMQQQQQMEQEAMQGEWIRQQQLQQQQEQWAAQQQQEQWAAQQQQQQQQQMMQEEFMRQQMILQQQQQAQQQAFAEEQQRQQQLLMLQQQQQQQQQPPQQSNPFSFQQQTQSPQPTPQPQASPQPTAVVRTRDDGANQHLASLFANRVDDGVDSFGNIGALRFGHANAGRLVGQPTGNPFARQMQSPVNGGGQPEQPFFSL